MLERRVRALLVSLDDVRSGEAWRQLAVRLCEQVDSAPEPDLPAREDLLARIAAARTRLAEAPALHQASLFDRRAELAASVRREAAAQIDAALALRAASLTLTGSLTSHPRLIALWPQRRKP